MNSTKKCESHRIPKQKESLILKFVYSVFFILISFNSIAQANLNFQVFNTKNGISSNQIYDIHQDINGLLWFATDRGICNYDGYFFKTFGIKDGLTSTTVFKFYPQENGDIWCSTANNRLFFFNPKDYQFHQYQFNNILEVESSGRIPNNLYFDNEGNIHIAFLDKTGVLSIDTKGKILSRITKGAKNSIFNDSLTVVYETMENGQTFLFTQDIPVQSIRDTKSSIKLSLKGRDRDNYRAAKRGKLKIITGAENIYIYNKENLHKTIACENTPISVGFYDSSHIWVGLMYGGVNIYDLDGNYSHSILDGESVSDIQFDHEDGMWISTIFSGVYYSSTPYINRHSFHKKSFIKNISVDRTNELTVDLVNGDIYKANNDFLENIYQSKLNDPSLNQYYKSFDISLTLRNRELIWSERDLVIKTKAHVSKFSDETNFKPWYVDTYRFYSFTPKEGLKIFDVGERINDVCPTQNDDEIYLASKSGLYHFDIESKKRKKVNHRLLNFHISDIDLYGNKYLVATRGNGLVIIDQDSIWSITESQGLSSDFISEVYVQNTSTIWACTNWGLNRIKLNADNSFTISTLSMKDGLIDNDITDIEITNGIVWISSQSGLSSFPLDLLNKKTPKRNFYLKILETKVNDSVTTTLSNLDYTQNKIEINFRAISFKNGNKLKYRYKLKGLSESWNYTNNLNVIYEDLQPGNYTFLLQVYFDNKWRGKDKSLTIVISPPYYQTLWFRVSLVLFIVMLIYLFFRFRILSYNRDISREILRQLLKRLKRKSTAFIVRGNRKDIKIDSKDVLFIKAADNYIEIHTSRGKVVVREKISNFLTLTPDPIEYIRIHRSCIVRIDKVTAKTPTSVTVNNIELKIGKSYLDVISQIHL